MKGITHYKDWTITLQPRIELTDNNNKVMARHYLVEHDGDEDLTFHTSSIVEAMTEIHEWENISNG